MQAQSRLLGAASGGSGSGIVGFGSGAGAEAREGEEEHEAVVRELTRGHELTARLRAEALRALRGQGQAEATATFILGEVSRTFTVCLSIMATAGAAASSPPRRPETPPDSAVSVGAPPPPPRARDDNVPRKRTLTPSPYDDGYQWRKYGQKRINNTNFPRSYYRCSYHRERRCPAQKHVQRHSAGGGGDDVPPMYVVVYTHEHTCQDSSPATDLPDATPDYFPGGETSPSPSLRRRHGAQPRAAPQVDARAAMEERERQVLVSSLACVLQGKQCYDDDAADGAAHAPPAPAPVADAGEGLDVMDYDVTEAMFWGPFGDDGNNSYGATDVDTLF